MRYTINEGKGRVCYTAREEVMVSLPETRDNQQLLPLSKGHWGERKYHSIARQ